MSAYQDQGGVWTIGYGHTGSDVHAGMNIIQEQAEGFLRSDYHSAVAAIRRMVKIDLTQHEFDALADFVFNVGSGNFAGSTLLKELNAGNLEAAANQFPAWSRVKGQVVAGLLRRRQEEAKLFQS